MTKVVGSFDFSPKPRCLGGYYSLKFNFQQLLLMVFGSKMPLNSRKQENWKKSEFPYANLTGFLKHYIRVPQSLDIHHIFHYLVAPSRINCWMGNFFHFLDSIDTLISLTLLKSELFWYSPLPFLHYNLVDNFVSFTLKYSSTIISFESPTTGLF